MKNEIEIEKTKKIAEYSISQIEQLTDRYIEAEKFLIELNWIERLFFSRKLLKFIDSRKKYNF